MFHGNVYRAIWVRAAEFNGDGGDVSIIDEFYFRSMCNLVIINGWEVVDGGIGFFVGLAILGCWGGGGVLRDFSGWKGSSW